MDFEKKKKDLTIHFSLDEIDKLTYERTLQQLADEISVIDTELNNSHREKYQNLELLIKSDLK